MAVAARYHYQRKVNRGSWIPRFTKQRINTRGTTAPTAPTLTSISPTTAEAGAANGTLTATGTGFISGITRITVDGNDQTTHFTSATVVTCPLTSSTYPGAGTLSVNVRNGPLFTATPKTFTFTEPEEP